MRRKFPLIIGLLVLVGTLAQAQGKPVLSFTLAPYIDLPIGASADRYSLAGGAALSGEYSFRGLPLAWWGSSKTRFSPDRRPLRSVR